MSDSIESAKWSNLPTTGNREPPHEGRRKEGDEGMRLAEETPTTNWSDQELVDYARSYARERRLPVVHVPLALTLSDEQPDTAVVRFDGRAPGPQITVRRYRR